MALAEMRTSFFAKSRRRSLLLKTQIKFALQNGSLGKIPLSQG
jgi:hypothetical protein